MSKERLGFEGQKPETLVERILILATKEGDWVLDSFLGTGTTAAVAHKMNRKWIGIELGDQAGTYVMPRLKKAIDGNNGNGSGQLSMWKGGGGFKYFELGDSLFVQDDDLKLTVLNPKVYNGALIRAVLKVEGFKLLHPDNGLHGISGQTIAHVTEQYLNQTYIDALLREVGDKADYLIIYAKTISSKIKLPENVEVRKIPDVLLRKFKI
jgi:adenine-specific DNA-methyltransferase